MTKGDKISLSNCEHVNSAVYPRFHLGAREDVTAQRAGSEGKVPSCSLIAPYSFLDVHSSC